MWNVATANTRTVWAGHLTRMIGKLIANVRSTYERHRTQGNDPRKDPHIMTSAKREARRKRDREDFLRVTTQAVRNHKLPQGASSPGSTAGNTYREHLEDEIDRAVKQWKKARASDTDPLQVRAMRGVVRGLCRALLIYEDSYHMNDKDKLLKLEKGFLNESA